MKKRRDQYRLQPNQWLFSCPIKLPTAKIAATLGMTHSGITEVNAHTWQGEWDMANAFVRAYGYGEPILSEFPIGSKVNWDALEDWMFIRTHLNNTTPPSPTSNFTGKVADTSTFVGEILIMRQCRPEQEKIICFVASMVDSYVKRESKHRQSDPVLTVRPLALVLEGWEASALILRQSECWVVNALPNENGQPVHI